MNAQYNEIFFTWKKNRILTPCLWLKGFSKLVICFHLQVLVIFHARACACSKSIDLICCFQIKNKCCLQLIKWHCVQIRGSFANLIGETREPLGVQIWCAPLSAR